MGRIGARVMDTKLVVEVFCRFEENDDKIRAGIDETGIGDAAV